MADRLTGIVIIDRLVEEYGELPTGLLVVSVTLVVVLIINHLVRTYLGKHLKNAGLRAVSLITNLLRVLVVVVAVFFLGENVFHVQMSGMVQALGVTTLVVSLGLQDVIKSLVAGMLVVGGDIVAVGDQVILGEHRGEVMDINWHQVTIRDRAGAFSAGALFGRDRLWDHGVRAHLYCGHRICDQCHGRRYVRHRGARVPLRHDSSGRSALEVTRLLLACLAHQHLARGVQIEFPAVGNA